jgi:uncharacterized membrane protein (DUF106 family)
MNTADFMTAGYLIFLFIGVALWVATRDNKHPNMASLGQMMEGILHNRATRLGLGIFWWWLGWHFLVSIISR